MRNKNEYYTELVPNFESEISEYQMTDKEKKLARIWYIRGAVAQQKLLEVENWPEWLKKNVEQILPSIVE